MTYAGLMLTLWRRAQQARARGLEVLPVTLDEWGAIPEMMGAPGYYVPLQMHGLALRLALHDHVGAFCPVCLSTAVERLARRCQS